jgi:hypothetical protein
MMICSPLRMRLQMLRPRHFESGLYVFLLVIFMWEVAKVAVGLLCLTDIR